MEYYVYKHVFPNGKIYIGITTQNPERRWANGFGYKTQPYVYRAIKKYGWSNITHEILFSGLSKEQAEKKEIELIAETKCNQREYGYNIANGGKSAGMMAEETKRQISQTLKGRPTHRTHWKGRHHSEESKAKLSSKRKGCLNPMYGKHISEETRAKMINSHKTGALCKTIRCVETGEIFVSSCDAARKMKLSQGLVSAVARGERKHTKGFHFEYIAKEITH